MHIHFISIGGAVMHNLALALHHKGYKVTGSDDEIYEPALTRLNKQGLLPKEFGWHVSNIDNKPDAVVLGMHARKDNPELMRALELGIKIYSFPAYIFEQTKDKTRVVIGGSHGKTTTTAMIMHVLRVLNKDFDYLVGSIIEHFETMVGLSDSSTVAVIEGDEYLSSAIDLRPKFHLYHAKIAIITGIAWDHINVFPTYEDYKKQFQLFIEQIPEDGTLIYCEADADLKLLAESTPCKGKKIAYNTPPFHIQNGVLYWELKDSGDLPLLFFGEHNLQNMMAAKIACEQIGISEIEFANAITLFKGTAKRLEVLSENAHSIVYRDFAHAPSKLKATIAAVKNQFPERKLIAAYELHTYSSLNKAFLPHYHHSMKDADIKAVLYSKHALEMKKMPMLDEQEVANAFGDGVKVFTDKLMLRAYLDEYYTGNENVLLMSSGTFDGMDTHFS